MGEADPKRLAKETGPAIAEYLLKTVDAAVYGRLRDGHRSSVIIQRAIEGSGIPTILISALPDISTRCGAPRSVSPVVPIGANAGAPNNPFQQRKFCGSLLHLIAIDKPGQMCRCP